MVGTIGIAKTKFQLNGRAGDVLKIAETFVSGLHGVGILLGLSSFPRFVTESSQVES
jgi:hypothetical protein